MPYITEMRKELEFNSALQNFSAVCTANTAALGLTPGTLSEITTAATALNTAMNNWMAAKASLVSSKENKDTELSEARDVVSKYAKTFRANSAISDMLLGDLLVAPHETPGSKTPPSVPLDLVGTSIGYGNIKLGWKRNGNIQGTTFVIEFQAAEGEPWVQVGTSTKRTFETSWTPGSYVGYRVTAVRRSISSIPSDPYFLWAGAPPVALKLAA